jgi:hypothetical protein
VTRRLRLLVVVLVGVTLACTAEPAVPPQSTTMNESAVKAESTPQPADLVDLTVYFRHGRGPGVYLSPVKREVPVSEDLPRMALGVLLKGPVKSDPRGLHAPLPTSTRLLALSVADGVADVRLSREAIVHSREVGSRPEHEAMALAAIANTLTEFPDIQRVRLRIQGHGGRRFWGGWGLPAVLVRDEGVMAAPKRGSVVPGLDGFSHRPGHVGVRHKRRQPAVAAVRVQPHTTFLRLTVEVTAAKGGPLSGPVPPSSARRRGQRLVLSVRGRPGKTLTGNLGDKINDPAVRSARIDVRGKPHRVVIALRPQRRTKFWLHTLSEPARVVLDVRR